MIRKFARAMTTRLDFPIQNGEWDKVRVASRAPKIGRNIMDQASGILGTEFSPKDYLLTHATIVCSVDTFAPPGVKVGKVSLEGGFRANRKWNDFRVTRKTQRFINNNHDGFERRVLLKAYPTFKGGHNFLEHEQDVEKSYGRILDAVARDTGDSVYVDFLVATDLKHKELIHRIREKGLRQMSMGCFMPNTQVLLGDGTGVNIQDIRPGMEVISQKGNICTVANLQIRWNRWSMRRIRATGLPTVEATDNHDFYVVPRQDVRRVCGAKKNRSRVSQEAYHFEKRAAGEIVPGDIIATPILQGESTPTCTEEEARFIGLWVGDGWRIDASRGRVAGVGLCLDSDEKHKEIVEFAENAIQRISWRSGEMRQVVGGEPVSRHVGKSLKRNTVYLTVSSGACHDLVTRHVSGSSDKSLSQDVMLWPRHHQLSFLSGLVDSDGCVSTTKAGVRQVFFSTRNENLARQVMAILNRCGLIGTMSAVRRSGTAMLPNAEGVDYQIRVKNAGVSDIPSVKIRSVGGNFDRKPTGNCDRWIAGNHLYTVVKSVETFEYQGFVYDMEVEGDHSYIANGYGVSNCSAQVTICVRCGNVATGEDDSCPCILNSKGDVFYDEDGFQQTIAELCGHHSLEGGGVVFEEGSWVEDPAFTGAVVRNFLEVGEDGDSSPYADKLQDVMSQPRALKDDGVRRAASEEGAPASKPSLDIETVSDEMAKLILERAMNKVRESISGPSSSPSAAEQMTGDGIIKQGSPPPAQVSPPVAPAQTPGVEKKASLPLYRQGISRIAASSRTDSEFIRRLALFNASMGMRVPSVFYSVVQRTGGTARYSSREDYLRACQEILGRTVSPAHSKVLTRLGGIFSRRKSST